MPTAVIDLGNADIQSRETDLCVRLQSAAQFAASEEDDIAELWRALMAARLTDQSRDRPWIHRGDGFKLVLSLQLEAVLGVHEQEEMVEILSDHLQKAEMWKQLHLTATAVQSSFDRDTGCFTITTHLAHVHSAPSKRRLHKLSTDVPFHDVRPPQGITEVSCQAVYITLRLSKHRQRKYKRDEKWNDSCDSSNDYERELSQDLIMDITEDQSSLRSRHAGDLDGHDTDPYPLNEAEMLGCPLELDMSGVLMLVDETRSSCCNSMTDQSVSEHLKRISSAPVDGIVTTQSCLLAIKAAFKFAICRGSSRRKFHISSSTNHSIRALCDVMPSIWNADFLPDVASRAIFIPTIAHALRSVLGSRPDGIEAQLWQNMRASLQKKSAPRKLSPLSEVAEDTAAGGDTLEDLVEFSDENDEMLELDGIYEIVMRDNSRLKDSTEISSLSGDEVLDPGLEEGWDIMNDPAEDMGEPIVPTAAYGYSRLRGSNKD